MHKLNQHFARKLVKKACSHVNLKRSRVGKKSNEYSRDHQYRIQKARVTNCKNALNFLAADGYTPLSIKVKTLEGEYGNINLERDLPVENTKNEAENLNSVLYIKDHFGISHAAYHELAIVCKNLPRKHQLQSTINQLNSSYYINTIPGDMIGFQQSICHMLDMVLKRHDAEELTIPEKIRIRLSGDGTWLRKRIHVVSFSFTLPDFPDAASAHGNNLIAIFRGSESYDQVKQSIRDIVEEAKMLQTLTFLGRTLLLEYYLGGDLKFLNMVCGIDPCSSKFSCLWCKCPSEDRCNTALTWSMVEEKHGEELIKRLQAWQQLNQSQISSPVAIPNI